MAYDFLVVAALNDEAREICALLEDVKPEDVFMVGRVRRWKNRGTYSVAVLNLHDGMGAAHAGPATQAAIAKSHPIAVLLTGIAAGFEDGPARVALGDLMIPYGIVPYELAKLRGATTSGAASTEHRGIAWAVSEGLWRTAANLAEDPNSRWSEDAHCLRPGGEGNPKVHCGADYVLGCGEKVVADGEAEVRRWLLAGYPRQALGLEMESFAVLRACRVTDTPFVVAKASVDRATVEKDDGWRHYACQVSARFLLATIEREGPPLDSGDFVLVYCLHSLESRPNAGPPSP